MDFDKLAELKLQKFLLNQNKYQQPTKKNKVVLRFDKIFNLHREFKQI